MRQLVLAGLGHAHLFVLEALRKGVLPECDVHVCTGEAEHVYSGMVPGWLAGRYERNEISLDVAKLCAAAGATWHPHHVRALHADAHAVTLTNGEQLAFDVASVAVGSVPAGLELLGARAHAVPLKPLGNVERIAERVAALRTAGTGANGRPTVSVVGGGLAGVEIALAVRARGGPGVDVRIITRDNTLAAGRGGALSRRLGDVCADQDVRVAYGITLREVTATHVHTTNGHAWPSDLTIWATGPAAAPWLGESGCAVDDRGFLLVDSALRSVSHPTVFAAGDCASLASAPGTPKAGVYAVRMGPKLALALGAALRGKPVRTRFSPQPRWLALVNTGDGGALASYGPFVLGGQWVMRWKDTIDRRFVDRFTA